MWDWKRPPFKESVTAQESRSQAPKIYRVLTNTLIPFYSSISIDEEVGSGASCTDEEQYFIVWR